MYAYPYAALGRIHKDTIESFVYVDSGLRQVDDTSVHRWGTEVINKGRFL